MSVIGFATVGEGAWANLRVLKKKYEINQRNKLNLLIKIFIFLTSLILKSIFIPPLAKLDYFAIDF